MNVLQNSREGAKYIRKLDKLKEKSIVDYKWFVYASLCGYVNSIGDVASPYKKIEFMKNEYKDISNAPKTRSSPKEFEIEYEDDDSVIVNNTVVERNCKYYFKNTNNEVTDFKPKEIEKCGKLLNPETEEELLNEAICQFKDGIKQSSKSVLGEYFTSQLFKPFN